MARGDLTQKITVEAKGEVAELADTMNEMTDTLAIFAEQVTSVAREWAPTRRAASRQLRAGCKYSCINGQQRIARSSNVVSNR